MRATLQTVYLLLLRLQGAYGIVLVGGFIFVGRDALAKGAYLEVPAGIAAVGALVAVLLVLKRLTPAWLAYPSRIAHIFPVLVVIKLMAGLFAVLAMMGVTMAGIAEPEARELAMLVAAPSVIMMGLAWVFGLLLCVMPGGAVAPPKFKADKPGEWSPPKDDMKFVGVDVRELRHSRMANLA